MLVHLRKTLPRLLRLSLAAGLMLGAALLLAAAPAEAQGRAGASRGGGDAYVFAFQDAEIAQVVREVLGQAGVPYVIDPAVTGKISFRIEQRLTREQLLASLEAVLAANNVAMVRNGDQLTITPQAKARSAAEIHRDVRGLRGSGYEVVAVPLGYAQPTEVARAMEAVGAGDAVLYANDKLSLLLLAGVGQQLKSALETLKVFDQSAFQDSRIRWFELTQAQASTVAAEIERIAQGAGLTGITVVPLKRLNGVIIFGRSTDALNEIGKWVVRLDTPGHEIGSTLFVYRPQFASAETLGRTIGGLLGGGGGGAAYMPTSPPAPASGPQPAAAPAPVGPPLSGGGSLAGDEEVRVSVDKESNTLLVFASPSKWVQIQRVLSEIDRPQRQVLIEASIVEVTLGKQFQFGVDWTLFSNNLQVSSVNNNTGTIKPSFPGFSITYLDNNIEATLKALGSKTAIQVVSAPKIIALDNRTAHLQVGDQVPVVTQTAQGTVTGNAPLVSTVDYRSTGVILTVTPRIAGQDRLVLEVSQEVSNVAKTLSSGIDSPTIQQRRFESQLVLENGRTVALGGLISSTDTDSNSGVPGLKDIPGLGALFRTQSRDHDRSELIILLSARIIEDRASSDKAMTDLASDMHELQSRGLLPAR